MKKIKLSTEGLTGANLEFVTTLNTRFAELPESLSAEDVAANVRTVMKGMLKLEQDADVATRFARIGSIDFDKLAELMSDEEGKGIRSILKRQGDTIASLKELGVPGENRVKNIRAQLTEYLEKNKEQLKSFRSGEARSFGTRQGRDGETEAGIEIRAVTMTVAASSGGSAFMPQVEVTPGLVGIARVNPFIEGYANTSNTSRPRIVWTEKYNVLGTAGFIAEGGVKPLISFEWRSFESYAKKVADKIKVSTEALDDVDWLAAEIESELKYQVDLKVDQELLSGAGDGTSGATTLKGLTAWIGGYVLTSVLTTTPNNFDALRAAYAQITSLFFQPTHVFINPIDAANMDLIKDSTGRPIAMEYRADGRIYRITPVETMQIPVGYFLMGDMSRFSIRNYKAFAIYYGWVNDDFEKNLVTIIGERRLHCYMASNNVGAFVYDQFSVVKLAITAP